MPHLAPHNHPFHEFYFSLSEGGTQYAETKAYPLKKRQLFTLPSPVFHFCHSDSPDHRVRAVVLYVHPEVFSGTGYADIEGQRMLSELVKRGREGRHEVNLSESTLQTLEEILVPLSRERVEKVPGYAMDIRSGFEKMLVALMRDPAFSGLFASRTPEPGQRMEHILHTIEVQFADPLTVEEMAKQSGCSRSHFHALFKEAVGVGFVEYLNGVRIRKASDLLKHGDLPLIEVGQACGFESLAHFYRCFRKRVGMPPGKFRKQHSLTI